jgi:hypothetical protein
MRIAGLAAAGAGGVALIVGIIAGLNANGTADEVEASARAYRPYDREQFSSGQSSATIATAGFIAAPVLVGTGALLYWLGRPTGRTVALLPALGRHGASLNLAAVY